ncbi:putative HSPB1-associated protein 1 [Apostichopus japonicus]|uniref:Putative HSPB1-associated protein 1 n=1 Tax=Stichopus japonicus TaxID=307972 RepID=A0A2G8KR20_STIJA|nr:putative HSPB1-associated protein 1 [Apostichopus japonicus]
MVFAVTGTLSQQNPLRKYDRDKFWCYADYKYMKDLFCDKQQIFEAIPWDSLGLNGYNGEQSTIWIGSSRAHTVCHQDAYGFNLVAQIQGRKKWYLFPPEQTDCLYPTRLPYEESSIFSEVNITEPDLAIHPRFQDSTPHVIVLEPGDVLYVPRHWWHYVECIDTSISVNCWVELENDHLSRLHESVTRMLVYGLLHHHPQQNELNPDWLNPTETLTSYNTNLLYLENSLEILKQLNGQRKAKGEASDKWDGREAGISFKSHEPVERKLLMSADSSEEHILRDGMLLDDEKQGVGQVVKGEDMERKSSKRTRSKLSLESRKRKQCAMTVSRIPPISVNEMLGCKFTENGGGASKDEEREDRGIMEVLTQCVTDPRVVAMVTDLLLEKLQNR